MKYIGKRYELLYVLSFLFFVSCTLKEIASPAPAINVLELHQKYKINLPEDHSNGYTWQLIEGYDLNLVDNYSTVWHGNEKGVDFNFNTLATGQTTLSFLLRKHTDTSELKHFIVKIGME